MLEKKLITLACAAAILATGACFLPPLPNRQPPAPPIALDLQGVKTIGVRVIDKSAAQHLSSESLSAAIAQRLTTQGRRAGLFAFPAGEGKEQDAVLQVTIATVSASKSADASHGGSFWDLNVDISAVLTKSGGAILWRDQVPTYHLRLWSKQEEEQALWKDDPALQAQLSREVANRLVFRLLNWKGN